jgi:RNA polymerase sigma factor (sigma-70 family)
MNAAQLEPLMRHLRTLVETQATTDFSDAALLEQFASRRDEAAFAALMCRHGGLVWHVCRRVLHHEQDTEDAFQATFLLLALKAASLRRKQGLGNWLYGVAYRVAMNARRKAARRRIQECRRAATMPQTLPDDAAVHELQWTLHEEINRLPLKYRITLVLCGLQGKSKSEAAQELGWKVGTFSGRMARARKMLEARMVRRGVMPLAAWAATAFPAKATVALIPSTLVQATIDAALRLAAGKALSAAIVSNRVAAMTKQALHAKSVMNWNMALLFALGLGLAGTSMAAFEAFRDEPTPIGRETEASVSDDRPAAQAKQPRVDLYGDSLPAGAVARLGTMRFRQDDIEAMGLSPDGRVLITKSCHRGSICAWEAGSGKPLWQCRPSSQWGVSRDGNGLLDVSFSPDGRMVAAICDCWSADGNAMCILLCDAKNGTVLRRIPEQGGFPTGTAFRFVQDASIWETVFSPDGKSIAVNMKGTIYLWSAETGKQIAKYVAATDADAPNRLSDAAIRFSSDGKTIVSAFNGKKVNHWDVGRRANTSVVELKTRERFWAQAMSDDGRLLAVAAGSTDAVVPFGPVLTSTLQLFDTTTGKECCEFQGDTTGIQSLVLSRDARTLIGISFETENQLSNVSVWSTRSGKLKHRFPIRVPSSFNFGVTPDGSKLYTSISSNHGQLGHGPGESVVRWWDVATGKELMTQPAHEDRINSLCFTPDGRFLLSAGHDRAVRVWDVASARNLRRVEDEGHYPTKLSVVSAQGTFLSAGGGDELCLFNSATGRRLQSLGLPPKPRAANAILEPYHRVNDFVVSPDGSKATSLRACYTKLSGDADYFFDFWDLAAREFRKSSAVPENVWFSHFHPDGKRFIGHLSAGDWDSAGPAVVNLETGQIEAALQHRDRPGKISATALDGRMLVTATADSWRSHNYRWVGTGPHAIHVWELHSAKECLTIPVKESGSGDHCNQIAVAPDCRTTVTVSHGETLHFWDMMTGEEVLRFAGAGAQITSLAFSPDSKLLATGHSDSAILLWDLMPVREHYESLLSKPDARQLAAWWEDLASTDARKAHQAIGRLIAAGDSATALLRTKLLPAPEARDRIAGLIADLDDDRFARREKASAALKRLLPQVRPALEKALAKTPSSEVRRRIESLLALPDLVVHDLQLLREIRGVQALEQIAALRPDATRSAALDFLKNLAAGAPEGRLTHEAKAAVDRLVKRGMAKPSQ